MPGTVLDFENPIVEREAKIQEFRRLAAVGIVDFSRELARLERKAERLRREVLARLTPWQRVQIARHPDRPLTLDYFRMLLTDFTELHGDRGFGDDRALVAGLGRLDATPVVALGQPKGRDTREKLARNFGMAELRVPIVAVITGEGGERRDPRHRGGRPGPDARARGLPRHLAGGLRLDPVAGPGQGARGGRGPQDDPGPRGRQAARHPARRAA
jgi:hypothetical protein